MSHQHPIVDRRTEKSIFLALLDTSKAKSESILLLKNESGQGKSKLLDLYETHCRENKIPVSRVDLKGGSLSPIDILRTIQTDFRHFFDLKRCNEILHQTISNPTPQISGNTGIGRTDYTFQTNIQMMGVTIEDQRLRWETGAQALLDDLLELTGGGQRQCIILFDTFEQASDETKKWLSNHILRMTTPQRINSLLVVIAGKEVPPPTGEWEHCCNTINLEPLQLEDWLEYAGLVVGNIPREYVERVYVRYKHSPLDMANVLNSLAPLGDTSNAG
jgi:hypothetical protein